MLRTLAFAAGFAAAQVVFTAGLVAATEFATPEDARALLDRAVVAMKQDEAKALEMFASGEGGFKSKDLYVWCANASDGVLTVHPTNKGKELRDIKGKHGAPFGETIMENAAEGTIKGDDLLVAAPRLGRTPREDHLLHQDRRSDLRGRVLR